MREKSKTCENCKYEDLSIGFEPCQSCAHHIKDGFVPAGNHDKPEEPEDEQHDCGDCAHNGATHNPLCENCTPFAIDGIPTRWEPRSDNRVSTEIKDSGERVNSEYRENVVRMIDGQVEKGYSKYGVLLEQNKTLTSKQRIEHLQEELIDALMYCEHIKAITDDGITANDYQRAALRTAGDDESKWLLNGVMGLCGESGEVIDIVKKAEFQGHELDKQHLAEELGDVAWYLAVATAAIGYNLGDIMMSNVEKLKARYPDGFDKARSINREESKNGGN